MNLLSDYIKEYVAFTKDECDLIIEFYEENVELICRSAHNISHNNYNNEVNFVSKKPKKIGFFEKLFNLFK